MHLDEEQVERVRHGELAHGDERSIREHLAVCAQCRTRVAAAARDEAEVYELLRGLDHAPPRVDAEHLAVRARTRTSSRMRWAAGLLVAAAAGSAAIGAPGLPVRGWLDAVAGRILARSDRSQAAATAAAPHPGLAGVALAPGEALQILFTSHQESGEVRVSLTDDSVVFVRTSTGAAAFTSDAGRLVVDNKGSTAAFEVRIPRAAPRVEIRIEGTRILIKEGAIITTAVPVSAQGSYVLRLAR